MHSKEFARKFNEYNPPKKVDFVMAWLLELIEREGRPLYVFFILGQVDTFMTLFKGVAWKPLLTGHIVNTTTILVTSVKTKETPRRRFRILRTRPPVTKFSFVISR